MNRPSVYIGSSKEGLDIARAIQVQLEQDCELTVWSEGMFGLSLGTLEALVNSLERFDFAVLVLTPDDVVISRDAVASTPRDNVMFELGLFMGRLGRSRTFIVCSRETTLKIPSDLAGVGVAGYTTPGPDGNLISALGVPCTHIRAAIRDLGTIEKERLLSFDGRIERPAGNEVDHVQMIRGIASVPRGYSLYLAVRPVALARIFPDVAAGVINPVDGQWTARALIGLPHERDQRFQLYLVAADEQARRMLEFYDDYGRETGKWLGFRELPQGCRIIDVIEVSRR